MDIRVLALFLTFIEMFVSPSSKMLVPRLRWGVCVHVYVYKEVSVHSPLSRVLLEIAVEFCQRHFHNQLHILFQILLIFYSKIY